MKGPTVTNKFLRPPLLKEKKKKKKNSIYRTQIGIHSIHTASALIGIDF